MLWISSVLMILKPYAHWLSIAPISVRWNFIETEWNLSANLGEISDLFIRTGLGMFNECPDGFHLIILAYEVRANDPNQRSRDSMGKIRKTTYLTQNMKQPENRGVSNDWKM